MHGSAHGRSIGRSFVGPWQFLSRCCSAASASGAGSQGDYQKFMSQYASDFQKYMQGRRLCADENQVYRTRLCTLQSVKQANQPTNKQTNKPTNKPRNEQTNKRTNEPNKQSNEPTNKKDKQGNTQANQQTRKQTNKQTNEQTNRQTTKQSRKQASNQPTKHTSKQTSKHTIRKISQVRCTRIAHTHYAKVERALLTQLQIKATLNVTERLFPGSAQSAS